MLGDIENSDILAIHSLEKVDQETPVNGPPAASTVFIPS
jgi:hypothetical protein